MPRLEAQEVPVQPLDCNRLRSSSAAAAALQTGAVATAGLAAELRRLNAAELLRCGDRAALSGALTMREAIVAISPVH